MRDQKTPVVRFETEEHQIMAVVSVAEIPMRVVVDVHGEGHGSLRAAGERAGGPAGAGPARAGSLRTGIAVRCWWC